MDRKHKDRFLRTASGTAMQNSSYPLTVLLAVLSAIAQDDFDALAEAVTDDVELSICGFGPLNGVWRGRSEVVAITRKNFGLIANQKPEVESMIAEGDAVVVLLRESGVFKSDGQPYSIRGVQWFTFANGKIKKIDEIVASVQA
jgi:ketosteroid isomerase-like protein